jgi:hypothetical protein
VDARGAAVGLAGDARARRIGGLVAEAHLLSCAVDSGALASAEAAGRAGAFGAAPAARLAWLRAIGAPAPESWYLHGWCESDANLTPLGAGARKGWEWIEGALREGRVVAEGGSSGRSVAASGAPGGTLPSLFAKGAGGGAAGGKRETQPARIAPPGLWAPDENMEGLREALRAARVDVLVTLPPPPPFFEARGGGGGGGGGGAAAAALADAAAGAGAKGTQRMGEKRGRGRAELTGSEEE